MLRTITPSEMKRVETRVMQETALTGEALMQNAAAHVARAVCRQAAGRAGQVVCLCGTGNNGGDGLAAMRIHCCPCRTGRPPAPRARPPVGIPPAPHAPRRFA